MQMSEEKFRAFCHNAFESLFRNGWLRALEINTHRNTGLIGKSAFFMGG
jgi:hypothetical protein